MLLGVLALGFWTRGLSVTQVQPLFAGTCALTSLVSAVACGHRSRRDPSEGLGWKFMSGALLASALGNVIMALMPSHPGLQGPSSLGILVPTTLSLLLMTGALLVWPWRESSTRRRAQHALGSALFVGSLLLVLGSLGTWDQGFHGQHPMNAVLLSTAFRLSLLGGLGLYLVGENPHRLRGVLGFVLVNVLVGVVYVAVLQTLLNHADLALVPLISLQSMVPLLLGLAAWSQAPVEGDLPAETEQASRNWELLPYGPFVLAGCALLAQQSMQQCPGSGVVIGFLALTGLLVLRQFLLLQEVSRAKSSLEERVEARTQEMKAIQTTLLRTERLNTVAILGAGLTHDLNNLLGVVSASAELLQDQLAQARVAESEQLRRIIRASDKASSLTRRLMGFVRKDTDPPRVILLAEELALLEDLFRILLPRTVTLRLETAPGLFPILSRRTHIEQILVNLVSNSRDATPSGGTITLRLDGLQGETGPLARIQVQDTGPGLPESVMQHLFEPFITTKLNGKGTGLGLASVKALVEGDGGAVAVSNAPGQGCTFTLTYPLASLDEEPCS